MDAPNPSATPGFGTRAPLHIGGVGLIVRDLEPTLRFYHEVIGLGVLERTAHRVRLGAGGVAFLDLEHQPQALPDDPRQAGLFHTAFLMPTRPDLAQWLRHAVQAGVQITGASDHGVSEAIYLDDPEGNGVEVYADRPPERWRWEGDQVVMPTDRLNVNDLLTEAGPDITPPPAGLRIGHVHLRVGDLPAAEAFYGDTVGLAVMRRRGGAAFLSSGGYHHHVAVNVWRSAGAGPRDERRAGLSFVSIAADDAASRPTEVTDPWGTRIRFVPV